MSVYGERKEMKFLIEVTVYWVLFLVKGQEAVNFHSKDNESFFVCMHFIIACPQY